MSKHLPDVCIFLVRSCKSQRFYIFKDRIGPVWLNVIEIGQLILRPTPKWRAAGCQFSRCSAASPFGKLHSLSWSPWRISEGQIETETTGCPIRSQQLVTGCKQLITYSGLIQRPVEETNHLARFCSPDGLAEADAEACASLCSHSPGILSIPSWNWFGPGPGERPLKPPGKM